MFKLRRKFQILTMILSVSWGLLSTSPAFAAKAAGTVCAASVEADDYNPFAYYYGKLLELKEVDHSAPYAVALRALIMMKANKTKLVYVKIKDLNPIHPITHEEAVEKLQERINAVKVLVSKKKISDEELTEVLPSKNSIRAIRSYQGEWVVFDGNGRLAAMEQVLSPDTQIQVEYFPVKSRLFNKVLRELREMRGVLD